MVACLIHIISTGIEKKYFDDKSEKSLEVFVTSRMCVFKLIKLNTFLMKPRKQKSKIF